MHHIDEVIISWIEPMLKNRIDDIANLIRSKIFNTLCELTNVALSKHGAQKTSVNPIKTLLVPFTNKLNPGQHANIYLSIKLPENVTRCSRLL